MRLTDVCENDNIRSEYARRAFNVSGLNSADLLYPPLVSGSELLYVAQYRAMAVCHGVMSQRSEAACHNGAYKTGCRCFADAAGNCDTLCLAAAFAPQLVSFDAFKCVFNGDDAVIILKQRGFFAGRAENCDCTLFKRLGDYSSMIVPSGADDHISRSYIFRLRQHGTAQGASVNGAGELGTDDFGKLSER